jgi:hypothetical protein
LGILKNALKKEFIKLARVGHGPIGYLTRLTKYFFFESCFETPNSTRSIKEEFERVKKCSVDSPNKTTAQVPGSSDEDWSPWEEQGFP